MNRLHRYKGILYLSALFLAVPLLVWRLGVADTVATARENRRVEREIATLEALPVAGYASRQIHLNAEMIHGGGLLEAVTNACENNKVKVARYTPYVTDEGNGLVKNTAEVTLTGHFRGIVRAIELIENSDIPCRIISVGLHIENVRKNRKAELSANILFQQITKTGNQ